MKKKFLVTVMAMLMMVSFMPSMAFAEGNTVSSWEELREAITKAKESTTIELSSNIISEKRIVIPEDKDITLVLNGNKIIRDLQEATADGEVITNKGTLTVTGGGVITGGNSSTPGGGIYNTGTLTVENVTVAENYAIQGAGIFTKGKTVIDGGEISYNRATQYQDEYEEYHAGQGGGIFVYQGELDISGNAKITRNVAEEGGGGIFARGHVAMSDGEISHNVAGSHAGGVYVYGSCDACPQESKDYRFVMTGGKIVNNSSETLGGGVYVDYYDMEMIMVGGEITNNRAGENGGGIFCNDSITVGGTAVVRNNTVDGKANNVYLEEDRYIVIDDVETPESEMSIAFSMADEGYFTDYTNDDLFDYFVADNTNAIITQNPTTGDWVYVAFFKVKFDMQGHGEAIKNRVVRIYTLLREPTDIVDPNYEFGGWYKDSDCTDAWDFGEDAVIKNMTLYAKWTPAAKGMTIGKIANKTYTGKRIVPNLAVWFGTEKLVKNVDYTIATCKYNKNVGTASVTIKGLGEYAGKTFKTATFKIVPKNTKIKSLSKGKKSFTVRVKKLSKSKVNGYKVRYSTKKDMSGAKTKTIGKKYYKTSVKVKNLKSKKSYYVQVCSYKKVSGKYYYSNWSKVKRVKTK